MKDPKTYGLLSVRQDDLCDVTLVASGVEAKAHRLVLASCSPYFRAMFTGPVVFEEQRRETITLQGLEGDALLLLVGYIYSGQIHVDEDNVQVQGNQLKLSFANRRRKSSRKYCSVCACFVVIFLLME